MRARPYVTSSAGILSSGLTSFSGFGCDSAAGSDPAADGCGPRRCFARPYWTGALSSRPGSGGSSCRAGGSGGSSYWRQGRSTGRSGFGAGRGGSSAGLSGGFSTGRSGLDSASGFGSGAGTRSGADIGVGSALRIGSGSRSTLNFGSDSVRGAGSGRSFGRSGISRKRGGADSRTSARSDGVLACSGEWSSARADSWLSRDCCFVRLGRRLSERGSRGRRGRRSRGRSSRGA